MKGAFSYVGFWQGKHFYLTQQDAPLGRIVSLGSDQTMQQATTVIAQSEMKLEDAVFCKGQLVLFYLKDAASLIRICTPQGELIRIWNFVRLRRLYAGHAERACDSSDRGPDPVL